MGANNRRIRRLIVDLLWEHGPMTKEKMATHLTQTKSVRVVPSPHTLSSLLAKNTQVIIVGSEKVENAVGVKSKHAIYDINRELIHSKDDITFTRSPSVATPNEKVKWRSVTNAVGIGFSHQNQMYVFIVCAVKATHSYC
jgi:hypothetical protein